MMLQIFGKSNLVIKLMNKNPSIFTQISSPVLNTLKSKFMNYEGTPFCFVETSHRSRFYDNLNNLTVEVIKQYFNAHQYQVLLMPSGSSMSSVYLNLVNPDTEIYFYSQGSFSIPFHQEMKKYHQATHKIDSFGELNELIYFSSNHGKKIIHYNKIQDGQQINFPIIPLEDRNNTTIIKNINYCFPWSENQNNTQDIIYFDTEAGFSVPGFTVFLINKQFLKNLSAKPNCPDMLDYLLMLKMKSIVNTPFTLCTFVLYENIKYSIHNRQKIAQQISHCKINYQKMLHSAGFKPSIKTEQNPENIREASNFIRVEYNQRILDAKNQIDQCGWTIPEFNTLCIFIQTQNLNPDFLLKVIDPETQSE